MQPYRRTDLAIVEHKPMFGLIRASKPVPPHKCNLPTARPWFRHYLTSKALYRCQCENIWEIRVDYDGKPFWNNVWTSDAKLFWQARGATLDMYGLLLSHECKLPGKWLHLWRALTGNTIYFGSLYRCIECKKIFKYDGKWIKSDLDAWKKLGGQGE